MRTANPQRIAVPAGNRTQHSGSLPQRQSAFPRGDQLGVGIHNGSGIKNEISAGNIFRPLSHCDLDSHRTLQLNDIAFVVVAAGNDIASAVQDLYQREHAAAADADAVNMLYPIGDLLNRFYHKL